MTRRDLLKQVPAAIALSAVRASAGETAVPTPGLFPGRVIAVKHAGAVARPNAAIQQMVRRGISELTGQANHVAAWRQLFHPGDVVLIKVNPSYHPETSTSPELLKEVINGLIVAGVRPGDIIVYERYEYLLTFVKPWLPGSIRTAFAAPGYYYDDQTPLFQGLNNTLGYDPDYFIDLPQYLKSWQDPNNPDHTRSYVAKILTTRATKIISLAQLKDHQASGVTLNLKNISAGCVNNWNRFHDNVDASGQVINHMLEAIPAVASLPVIRSKVVLGIIDGINCLFNGGPLKYADPIYGFVTETDTIYFATDIVAADRIGWLAIDAERAKHDLPPEEFAGKDWADQYDYRQPQHIIAAGQLGLGEYRDDHIDLRQLVLA